MVERQTEIFPQKGRWKNDCLNNKYAQRKCNVDDELLTNKAHTFSKVNKGKSSHAHHRNEEQNSVNLDYRKRGRSSSSSLLLLRFVERQNVWFSCLTYVGDQRKWFLILLRLNGYFSCFALLCAFFHSISFVYLSFIFILCVCIVYRLSQYYISTTSPPVSLSLTFSVYKNKSLDIFHFCGR